ncbi:MAG: cysteine--tRNA ligase [Anaerolineae bacterium]|nr:cysteine--tRNA ligase [Anaerolineae bacterium]
MALEVFNTMGRRKEVFQPLREGFVGIYVCGPTVYDHAHIGHAKSYVSFDVIVRYLRHLGYRVRYVQNITDVGHLTDDADEGEDKIVRRAAAERVEPMELVETYVRSYFEDMDALGNARPDISPRASAHIPEQIELVQELLDRGYAYEVKGSVYFSVEKFPDYGKLSGRRIEDLMEGARVEVNPDKRNPLDFALWKKAEPGHILRWRSPWGWGFPGWHLECSAMGTKYLGQPFDIHGGGLENQFPHHESEIAQSEAARGVPLARYWLHNNMVTVGGQKMGKSLGNAIYLKDLFRRYDPLVVRYFILNSHYRSPLDFTDEALSAAERGLQRLHNGVRALRSALARAEDGSLAEGVRQIVDSTRSAFTAAMDDDFNTAAALAALFDLARAANGLLSQRSLSREELQALDAVFRELGGQVLGIVPDKLPEESGAGLEAELIRLLIELRQEFRADRQWDKADAIRDRLSALGVQLEDKPEGTTYRLVAAG